jgi:hypothetical protein
MVLKEISLKLPNRAGSLVGVARILAEHRINLAAISVDSNSRVGNVRLVVSNPERAVRLLEKAQYRPEVHDLLAVHLEDRAGTFLRVLDLLARERLNVRGVVILVVRQGTRTLVGLELDEIERARQVLVQAGFFSEEVERLISNSDLVAAAPVIPAESVGMLL